MLVALGEQAQGKCRHWTVGPALVETLKEIR